MPPGEPLVLAGDFNDWGERLDAPMRAMGLTRAIGRRRSAPNLTFPSRVPIFSLDRIYTRGFSCCHSFVPRGKTWARMSDHLPLVAELLPEVGMADGRSDVRHRCRRAALPPDVPWSSLPRPVFSGGNRVRLLKGGDELFPAMAAGDRPGAPRDLAGHLHLP